MSTAKNTPTPAPATAPASAPGNDQDAQQPEGGQAPAEETAEALAGTATAPAADEQPQESDPEALAGAGDDDQEPEPDESTALSRARREAAERRVAAREATERADGLQEQLEAAQARTEALENVLMAQALRHERVSAEAVRALGHTAADLLGEDLTPDPAAVARIAADVAAKFGRLPASPTETARAEYASAHDWPADLLYGDDAAAWARQKDALSRELVSRFPHLTAQERSQQFAAHLALVPEDRDRPGQAAKRETFDRERGQAFMAWATRHGLWDPATPLPPRDAETIRRRSRAGQAPGSGSTGSDGGGPATWGEVLGQ